MFSATIKFRRLPQLLRSSFNNVHTRNCTATGIIKRTRLFLITGRTRFISVVIQFT